MIAFLASPLGRWLVVGALMLAAIGAAYVKGMESGYENGMAVVENQRKADVAAAAAQAAKLQKKADDLAAKNERDKREADQKLKAQKAATDLALAQQSERLPHDIPLEAMARCPDLPYGYLLHRANGADAANGRAASHPEPTPGIAAAPTGVSLTDLAAVDDKAASAFRQWREYASGLEEHVTRLEVDGARVRELCNSQ